MVRMPSRGCRPLEPADTETRHVNRSFGLNLCIHFPRADSERHKGRASGISGMAHSIRRLLPTIRLMILTQHRPLR
jgi:hypothetical protein